MGNPHGRQEKGREEVLVIVHPNLNNNLADTIVVQGPPAGRGRRSCVNREYCTKPRGGAASFPCVSRRSAAAEHRCGMNVILLFSNET